MRAVYDWKSKSGRDDPFGVPPESLGLRRLVVARCRSAHRTPSTLACTPSAPIAGSAYLVPRSPFAVSTALGSSRRRAPHTLPRMRRRSCAWPVPGVSALRVPFPTPKGEEPTLLGFHPLRHKPARRIRSFPGVPCPGTFRPQGLNTLSTAFSPPSLATARRPPQRPWGSPFRALLLPVSGTPLGASPLLSFSRPGRSPSDRDFRG